MDVFDAYGAAYVLCNDFHSGQWSLGYRILCWLQKRGYSPGLAISNGEFETVEQEQLYLAWRDKYSKRL